ILGGLGSATYVLWQRMAARATSTYVAPDEASTQPIPNSSQLSQQQNITEYQQNPTLPTHSDATNPPDVAASDQQGVPSPDTQAAQDRDEKKAHKLQPTIPISKPKEGFLKVSAFPWADYWVDGKAYQRAQNKAIPLKPGKHSVGAGQQGK